MDPLSISASIIAVLQLTGTVIQCLSTVEGASKDRQRIFSELCNVSSMLYVLKDEASQVQQGDAWSSTLLSLNGPDGPIEQFKTALERLAKKLTPAKGLKKVGQAITWPFQKEEIKEILDVIERQKNFFTLARQNDHIGLSKAIKGDIVSLRSEVGEVGKRIVQFDIDEKIRRWLAAPDPSLNYKKALEERHLKTGTWFVESKVFADWKTIPASFFWLYGIPGCGKTILSSTIIENVTNHCDLKPTLAVLYFYFDFNDVEKQGQENMIRSLILQLSSQSGSTPQALKALYSSCISGERQPTRNMLLATLHQMMGSFEETFIILDALDECSERRKLLDNIEEFNRWTDANLHILCTSRREKGIEERIGPLAHDQGKMPIDSVRVNDDIRAYVHERLRADPELKRWHNAPKVQKEIEKTLLDKADGMFRWAACQLDSLRSCVNLHGLRTKLASLPKDLDETYDRILDSIDEDNQQDALKILQWLTYSARPLRLEEMVEIIAIDIKESPRFDATKRYQEPRDIWMICSSLISLQEEVLEDTDTGNTIIQLAHFSVKEYLISPRIQKGRVGHYSIQEVDANAVIAESCLAYLLQFDEPGPLTTQSVLEYPLAHYAAEYWTKHAQVAERNSTLAPLLSMEFLLTKGHSLLNWLRLYDPESSWRRSDMTRGFDDVSPPLYYASFAGLTRSVQSLLDRGADINANDGLYGTALQAAAYRGHDQVVQILLDKGADVNIQGGRYTTALQAASSQGFDQLVQILLKNGANVNIQGRAGFGTALQAASGEGHDQVVQTLLNRGAWVNAQGGTYGNALYAASDGGHNQIVQMLLDKGANIDAQVLRLSRPALSQRFPLPLPPKSSTAYINPNVALDLKTGETDDEFIFDPVLTLPPAFGSAYVGESFSCTLCANNELLGDAERHVSSVRIEAEMQTPSGTSPLELRQGEEESSSLQLMPGESIQKTVQFDLREEGSHTLAVNLSYSETTMSKDLSASSGRVRTFRKLYQFVARPCLSVRTKVSSVPIANTEDGQKFLIEVQLENMADGTIILKAVAFNTKPAFKSTSLNWDLARPDVQHSSCPSMAPRDVLQIAFLVEQRIDGPSKEVTKDGRTTLGQLSIQWRSNMGDSGFLSTGWLTTKRK